MTGKELFEIWESKRHSEYYRLAWEDLNESTQRAWEHLAEYLKMRKSAVFTPAPEGATSCGLPPTGKMQT